MGDYWCHEVMLEERVESSTKRPQCLSGERHCPPEDCGGILSYQEVVRALSGEASELEPVEVSEWLAWAGEGFDPAFFNLEATNTRLRWN